MYFTIDVTLSIRRPQNCRKNVPDVERGVTRIETSRNESYRIVSKKFVTMTRADMYFTGSGRGRVKALTSMKSLFGFYRDPFTVLQYFRAGPLPRTRGVSQRFSRPWPLLLFEARSILNLHSDAVHRATSCCSPLPASRFSLFDDGWEGRGDTWHHLRPKQDRTGSDAVVVSTAGQTGRTHCEIQ